jgi:formylmethanofuran dehydrogenase subunit D
MPYKIEAHTHEFLSFAAGDTITAGMLVALNDSYEVIPCTTSTTNCVGIADEAASDGDDVRVLQGNVIVYVQAADAVTAGASLETAAGGQVDDTSGTGMTLQAFAIDAATAGDDWIRIMGNFPCTA